MKTRRVKIVNLLATDLTLLSGPDGAGVTKTYYNPGPAAKVSSKMTAIAQIHPWENGSGHLSVPLLSVSETRVIGLPDPADDTLYVVSGAVAGFLKGSRPDVVTPSRIVEDKDGWIVGCKALLQIREERG
jgi:hypothetical protein